MGEGVEAIFGRCLKEKAFLEGFPQQENHEISSRLDSFYHFHSPDSSGDRRELGAGGDGQEAWGLCGGQDCCTNIFISASHQIKIIASLLKSCC